MTFERKKLNLRILLFCRKYQKYQIYHKHSNNRKDVISSCIGYQFHSEKENSFMTVTNFLKELKKYSRKCDESS